jgi:undecaprenyl-diphosphatase
VIRYFAVHATPQFIAAMKSITFLGSTSFLLPAYLVLILWLLFVRKPQQAFDIAVVAISSTAMMFALKEFFKRQRPALPIIKNVSGYSFPSGHSLSSFIFCTVLIYLVWNGHWPKPVKVLVILLLVLLALTIGLSRVVLNVHYATDVIGGLCLGMIWAIISFFLIRKLRKKTIQGDTGVGRKG